MDKSHDNPEDNPVLKKPKLKLQKDSDLKKKRKTGDASGSDEDSDEKKKKKKDADSDEKKKKKKDADSDEKKKKKKGDYSGFGEDTDEKKQSKKLKGKAQMNVTKVDSVKEEDILPEGVMKQLMRNLLKSSLVKAESDEENELKQGKKGKKKEKMLSADEVRHQEYLKKYPILQARSAPTALHTAIHGVKNVDIHKFLLEIGFGSYIKFDITKIPARLGRYVVENFDADTCRLKLEGERFIEVTVTKVHELLGIPNGGQSLFSLPVEVGDDFEKVWVGQFEGKTAKLIRVNDIANKLIESKEVDLLFKVNFLTLFTNTMGMVRGLQGELNFDVVKHVREGTDVRNIDWCGYIFHCLKLSKKPTTLQNKYTGPYTLLALLYLDGTNFKKLPVVRTRPAIKQWSSFLMSQRQDMELKEECIGQSEIYDESEPPETEGFVAGSSSSYKKYLINTLEERLALIFDERASFEELLTTAATEFPADVNVIELHQKYAQIFKHPVTLPGDDIDADDDTGKDRRLSGTHSGH